MEADSSKVREGVLDWWDQAMQTRLNDPQTGAFIIIMQRLHEQKHVIDLTRIPDDQLKSIEDAFSRTDVGTGESGEVSQIIEGIYEG